MVSEGQTAIKMFQSLPFTPGEITMGFAAVIAAGLAYRISATKSAMKVEFQDKAEEIRKDISGQIDKLRGEFTSYYLPTSLATSERSALLTRIEAVERDMDKTQKHLKDEIEKNRDNIHRLRGDFTTLIMGKLNQMESDLQHRTRHVENINDKVSTTEQLLHDVSRRLEKLENR